MQKPKLERESKINKNLVLEFLQNNPLIHIEIEKMAKTLGIEEFTIRDILLNFAREKNLPGLLVFPNLYFDLQYCLDVIQTLAEKQMSYKIPLKLLAKEYDITEYNVKKMVIELIMNHGLQGNIDYKQKLLILQDNLIEKKNLVCLYCNTELTPSSTICPNCRAEFKKCSVCNFNIGNNEFINCPFCHQPAHKDHLLEWVKIKGKCPVCKHKLTKQLL